MKDYLVILVWLTNSEGLLLDCPSKCKCNTNTSSLKCTGVMPSFIPKHTTEVTIYNAPFTEKFDFSHGGWGKIKKLSMNPYLNEKDEASDRVLQSQELKMLKSIENLQIFCPYLKDIEEGAFSDKKKLNCVTSE